MRKWFIAAALALPMGGCITDQLNKGLSFMVGQNIEYAVQRLGYPDSQRAMLGDTLYVWSTSRNVAMPVLTTSNTSGSVGSIPVYGTTTSTTFVPANFNCTIQLAAGSDHIIKSWQWEGNMGGCAAFARRLGQ